jgi:hypothetical protein
MPVAGAQHVDVVLVRWLGPSLLGRSIIDLPPSGSGVFERSGGRSDSCQSNCHCACPRLGMGQRQSP